MAAHEYSDFDLLVEPTMDGRYRARVVDSPVGQATAEFDWPFSDLEMENFLLRIGRPRRGVRRLESPEVEQVRTFGTSLFDAVFSGDVKESLRRSIDETERGSEGLRIRLRLNGVPELANAPWEYLFSDARDRFLALSSWTPIVRYLDLPWGVAPLKVELPMRLLVVVSSPSDFPGLDVDEEKRKVLASLAGLVERGLVQLDILEEASLVELQRKLRRSGYHVLHYIGHGGFDEAAEDGVLVFEDETGRSKRISGRDLGTILHDQRSLRLVVLNACEGARASAEDPFAGTAQNLVRQGIPAVVAMQFEITDDAAITFAYELYQAVAEGYPIDAALAEARKAIFGHGNGIEWGTPVLYMRTPDGQIFDVLEVPARPEAGEVGIVATASETEAPAAPPMQADTPEPVVYRAAAAETAAIDSGSVAGLPTHAELEPEVVTELEPEVVTELEPDVATELEPEVVTELEPEVVTEPAETTEAPETQPDVSTQHVAVPGDSREQVEPDGRPVPQAGPSPPPAVLPGAEPTPGPPPAARNVGILAAAMGALALIVVLVWVIASRDGGSTETTQAAPGRTPTTQAGNAGATPAPQVQETTAATTTILDEPAVPRPSAEDAAAVAVRLEQPPVVDGSGDDWGDRGFDHAVPHLIFTPSEIRDGATKRLGVDPTATIVLGWDDRALYVLAEVEDDIRSQPNVGNQIWRGDAVDLNLDINPFGSAPARPAGSSFQLTLSPGDPEAGTGTDSVLFTGNGSGFDANRTGVAAVAAAPADGAGYVLEASVAWSELGLSGPPTVAFSALVAVFDNDGESSGGAFLQSAIVANTPGAGFQRPQEWGSLEFID